MNTIECPKCGTKIPDNANQCVQCKTVLIPKEKEKLFCVKCGADLEEEASVCPMCGCPVKDGVTAKASWTFQEEETAMPDQKRRRIKMIILAIMLLLALLIAMDAIRYQKEMDLQGDPAYQQEQ